MKNFFTPKSIAIIGASASPGKIGRILMENLTSAKNAKLYPVNLTQSKILGKKSYASVSEIKVAIDLAIVAVPAKFVIGVVKECAVRSRPIRNIVIISAGFSEIGAVGRKKEEELKKIAQDYKLNILGPNCLGLANTGQNLNASFANKEIPKGSVGLIAQSGALVTALLDTAEFSGFGFSLIATLGNKAVVNENDLLKIYEKDKNTKVIAVYLEDIAAGKEFKELLYKVSRKKPVVIIKSGTSNAAQKAILSHTGAMAGEADVTRQAIEENGGIFCESLEEFMGAIKFLDNYSLPKNNKVAILTNAGGPGVITTDLIAATNNLELANFNADWQKSVKKSLPQEASLKNPIDVLGDADEKRYKIVLEKLKKVKDLGAVLVLMTPQAQTPIEKIVQQVIWANKNLSIPVLPVVIGKKALEVASKELIKKDLVAFDYPLEAIRALQKAYEYSMTKDKKKKRLKPRIDNKRQEQTIKIIKKVGKRKVFYYEEAEKLGTLYKVNLVHAKYVDSKNDIQKKEFSFPVVLKIDTPRILHKNAKNGLALGIQTKQSLMGALDHLRKFFPSSETRMLTQKQVEPGFEVIIGLKKDPYFGHVLMVGLGGILTEIFHERVLWFIPTDRAQIEKRIKESRLGKMLKKRGLSIVQLAKEAEKVMQIAVENPQIKELDVNPIFLYEKEEPKVVDFKVMIE